MAKQKQKLFLMVLEKVIATNIPQRSSHPKQRSNNPGNQQKDQ